MSDSQIRMGIIGVGWFALGAHWPRLKDDNRVKVTAICRRNEKLLAKAASITGVENTYIDWREMLDKENLDAVLITTPNNYHAEPAIAVLEKGLHVLVEKPMALTIKDAEAVIDAANNSEGHLMVAYNKRCSSEWRKVKNALEDNAIGTIRQFAASAFINMYFHDFSNVPAGGRELLEKSGPLRPFLQEIMRDGTWRGNPEATGGGMFVDVQTHHIDLMLWLAGAPAVEVSCTLNKDGWPTERALATHAKLANNILFSFSFTNGVDADQEKYLGMTQTTITGDKGVIRCVEGPLGADGTQVEIISGGERKQITSDEDTGGTTGMFIDLIANGGENPAPPEECVWAVALTEASYRSAEEKRIVMLE